MLNFANAISAIRLGAASHVIDNVIAFATPDTFLEFVATKPKLYTVAEIEFDAIADHMAGGAFLLDVRRDAELSEHGYISGAKNIAHTRLFARLDEVPKDREIIVHCQTGIRSGYASGLLSRHGYRVTNVRGGFEAYKSGGATVASDWR